MSKLVSSRLRSYEQRLDARLDKKTRIGVIELNVNETLCVYGKQRDYTLNLMRNISGYVVGHRTPVKVSLKHCPDITAGALLILFAEVSRAKIATEDNNLITLELPENSSLRTSLDNIGWSTAITANFRDYPELMAKNCSFQTASEPHEAMESIYNLLINSKIELSSPESKMFTKGVNEAILNVFNHAYSHEKYPLDGIGRRWWQACWITNNNSLVYLIFDLGQGITYSLPKAHSHESIAEHITRAMRLGITCTGDSKRGKGSENMKNATEIKDKSTLFIGSKNALYTKLAGEEAKASECRLPFNGTLAEWQINING